MTSRRCYILLALLSLLAGATVVNAQANRVSGSAVRGVVRYSDTNNPVRRANVRLIGIDDSEDQPTVVTDRKGEFVLTDVPAGHYLAIAEATDLVSPLLFSSRDSIWDDWLWGDIAFGCAEVNVTATTAPNITLVAQRGGAITGRITDRDGFPISEAKVSVYWADDDEPAPYPLTVSYGVRSDDRGVYRIAGLPTGKYLIRVNDSDLDLPASTNADLYLDGTHVATYYPDTPSMTEAARIELVAGRDTAGIDIRFPERKTYKVGGTIVLASSSRPLSGMTFVLTTETDPSLQIDGETGSGWVFDRSGEWSVADLPDGRYVLSVDSLGDSQENRANGDQRAVNVLPQRFEFVVAGSDVPNLIIPVSEAAALSGKVTFTGPNRRRSILSVEAIEASVFESGLDYRDDKWSSWISPINEGGTFKFTQLPEGRYYLRIDGKEAFSFQPARVMLNGVELTNKPIAVKVGTTTELTMSIAPAATNVRLITPRDPKAAGANADVLFILRPLEKAEWRAMSDPLIYRADKNGRISVPFRPGEYAVVAVRRSPGHPPVLGDEFLEGDATGFTRFRVSANQTALDVTVTLAPEAQK